MSLSDTTLAMLFSENLFTALCGGTLCHSWAPSPSTKGTGDALPATFTYVGESYIQ